jgi:hypothetical protein
VSARGDTSTRLEPRNLQIRAVAPHGGHGREDPKPSNWLNEMSKEVYVSHRRQLSDLLRFARL